MLLQFEHLIFGLSYEIVTSVYEISVQNIFEFARISAISEVSFTEAVWQADMDAWRSFVRERLTD